MSALALSLKLSAVKTLSAVQRAINILKSSGPGAWYDPSDIANYTASLGAELVTNGDNETALFNFGTISSADTLARAAAPGGGFAASATSTTSTSTAHRFQELSGLLQGGKTYRIRGRFYVPTGGVATLRVFDNTDGSWFGLSDATKDQWVSFSVIRPAKATNWNFAIGDHIAGVVTSGQIAYWIDDLSITELTGLSACTMFQDSAGTTPVTAVEQPVGLMLDKSKGLVLGAELVTNGTFDTNTTGWTASGAVLSVVGGQIQVQTTAAGVGFAYQSFATTIGRTYKFTIDCNIISGTGFISVGSGMGGVENHSSGSFTVSSSRTIHFVATATTTFLGLFQYTATAGLQARYDNISVRELPGAHLIQPTATSRPTLSSRYNQIVCSTGAATFWQQYNGSVITPNYSTGPDGVEPAARILTGSGSTGTVRIPTSGITLSLGKTYRAAVAIKSNTASSYDLALQIGDTIVANAHVTPEWTVFSGSGGPAGEAYNFIDLELIPTNSDISVCQVSVAHAADASRPYQRVNTATDYDFDFSKFPAYLKFDGVDDSLYTAASVDFTSTDKMTVFAGVHKSNDTLYQTVLETGVGGSNGSIGVRSNNGIAGTYALLSQGTAMAQATTAASYSGPSTNVLTSVAAIDTDTAVLRDNGVQVASVATNQGTGNYGNYPLYVGRRNNASLPFNGRLYQLAIKGKSMTAAEITTVESFVNSKTKAY